MIIQVAKETRCDYMLPSCAMSTNRGLSPFYLSYLSIFFSKGLFKSFLDITERFLKEIDDTFIILVLIFILLPLIL